jgi:hypothetical protein
MYGYHLQARVRARTCPNENTCTHKRTHAHARTHTHKHAHSVDARRRQDRHKHRRAHACHPTFLNILPHAVPLLHAHTQSYRLLRLFDLNAIVFIPHRVQTPGLILCAAPLAVDNEFILIMLQNVSRGWMGVWGCRCAYVWGRSRACNFDCQRGRVAAVSTEPAKAVQSTTTTIQQRESSMRPDGYPAQSALLCQSGRRPRV